MVRFAGRTSTMDNREELLDALNDFSRKQPKEIPAVLDQFLKQVAKTGETLFPWTLLKPLFVAKLEMVMGEFSKEFDVDQLPPCPNVDNAHFDVYRTRIMEAVHRFNGAPFTIQRLCELLTDPKQHYKRGDKFMRGLEKNILVVSTVDPFGKKVVSESKNLMNGMDSNNSSEETSPTGATATPPVPLWTSASPTAVWPLNADIITPSTSPLLEVSDQLPDPKEAATTTITTTTTTPTSEESSASSSAVPVNGPDVSSTADGMVEITTDSATAITSTRSADSSDTAVSVVSPTVSTAETVDSSDQQVAAEEMVGVEEGEAATSTAASQQAASRVEGEVVGETVVAEVAKASMESEGTEGSREATPAASGDWLSNITDKEPEATPCSTGLQDSSSSDANTVTPDTSSSTPPTDSIAVNTSAKQETDSTKTGADSEGKEGGEEKEGVGEEEGEATVGETVTVSASEADVGSGEKTDPVTDTSLTSSSAEPAEENISVDSSLPHPVPREAETVPATSSEASTSSSEVSAPSTSLPETTDNTSPSSSPIDTTSTTTSSSPVDTITTTTTSTSAVDTTTSKEDKVKESLSAEAEPTGSMDLDSMDFSNSVLQAAESSEASTVASSSEIKDMQGAEVSDSSSQPEPMEQD